MKQYIREQFRHFKKNDFNPAGELKEAALIFIAWSVPAFLFVLWVAIYYPNVEFYQKAIREGVGPNLWNAIGSFGFFIFGISIIFSKYSPPSIIAEKILSNTFAIGSLSFGLVFGQWCILLGQGDLIWWERGLFGITSGLLLLVVLAYNFVIWYMCFLIKNDGKTKSIFLVKLEQMHWLWKTVIGSAFCAVISFFFLTET